MRKMHKTNGLNADAKHNRAKSVIVEKVKRRPMSGPLEASTQAAVSQPANCNDVKFPLCDAAVRKMEGGKWDLAYAILAECSESGEDGVQNGSYAKMEAMRYEIAKNHGVDLTFERIRKLRKVASAFPPGRRRPDVSLEGHLEAGTPEALDAFINSAPKGTTLTRKYIQQQKHPEKKAEQEQQKAERRRQGEEQRLALLNVCKQLERERDVRDQQYAELCRSAGKDPEPISPPLVPEGEPPRTLAGDLEQAIGMVLIARGFDPKADRIKKAIGDFVSAVLAQAQ
ncbi:MAG: hypothetical protein WB689_06995 [Xanthobacteraceae bacterium]